ncbi:MAG: hypothetical protein M3Q64_01975 [bacterium]|nr:hypothetical protein [bacterium]
MKQLLHTVGILFLCLVLSNCNQTVKKTEPHTTNSGPLILALTDQMIEERVALSRPIVNKWITSAFLVANITNDSQAMQAITIMRNKCYGLPVAIEGKRGTHDITAPENPNAPGICYTVVTRTDKLLMMPWAGEYNFQIAASYADSRISLDAELDALMSNLYLRGLILHHEMHHWKQDVVEKRLGKISRFMVEVEAYEYQFTLLDRLKLPGYDKFIQEELAKPYLPPNKPYLNERIAQMFGGFTSQVELEVAGYLMYRRVMFKKYDQDSSTALSKKEVFMRMSSDKSNH